MTSWWKHVCACINTEKKESNFRWSIAMMANNGHCIGLLLLERQLSVENKIISLKFRLAKTDHQWWRGEFPRAASASASVTVLVKEAMRWAVALTATAVAAGLLETPCSAPPAIDQRFDHSFLSYFIKSPPFYRVTKLLWDQMSEAKGTANGVGWIIEWASFSNTFKITLKYS